MLPVSAASEPANQLTVSVVDQVIRHRRTRKILGDLHAPACIPPEFAAQVEQAIEVAGWAPFHLPANKVHRHSPLDSCVPWRFYALNHTSCLQLAHTLVDNAIGNSAPESTIIRLLAAAGALVLCTWLPEPGSSEHTQQLNEEHLAAAAAAVQNLLLASEARGMQTYWSSGSVLKTAACFQLCNIPANQHLVGAIFLFPANTPTNADIHEGKLRHQRGGVETWRSWIDLLSPPTDATET